MRSFATLKTEITVFSSSQICWLSVIVIEMNFVRASYQLWIRAAGLSKKRLAAVVMAPRRMGSQKR